MVVVAAGSCPSWGCVELRVGSGHVCCLTATMSHLNPKAKSTRTGSLPAAKVNEKGAAL